MSNKVHSYEEFMLWQKGVEFVKQVCFIAGSRKLSNNFNTLDQLRGAALSITSNIAEGFDNASYKDYLNFLNVAQGSAGEARILLRDARATGYLEEPQFSELQQAILDLSACLANQINSLKMVN